MSRWNDHEGSAVGAVVKRAGSPYATGGGGVVLEQAYGAVVLAALVRQSPVRGLGDEVTPVQVRFQQGASYPVDDVVVVGQCATGERWLFVGVRRAPTIGASSAPFVGLLADYVRMVVDHRPEFDADRFRLGLAVATPHTASAEVATLAWHARKHHSHAEFRAAVNAPQAMRRKLRERLSIFDAAVEAAAGHAGVDTERDELTWHLLRALRVIHLALEGDDPADRSRTVGELTSLAGGVAQATDLWRQLLELSAGYAQAAATVNRNLMLRDLSTRFDLRPLGLVDHSVSVVSGRRSPASVPSLTVVRVLDADPRRLGVHASIRVDGVDSDMPSYVERDVDGGGRGVRALLAKAAERGGFVLLVGGSSVGKTRCAYEAVRAVLPDWWLVHPGGPHDIAALADDPLDQTVLWLDEIQRYFGGEHGLTGGVVRELLAAESPVVIVGTLWPDRYLRYTETPAYDSADLHGHEREVIELAEVVVVPETFSLAEQHRATAAAMTDRLLATALDTAGYGVTQTLAAAPQLVSHWEIAKTVHPYAWAVLLAAIDISRLGAEHPLPQALLRSAAPGHCTARQRAEAPEDWFERGMAYATRNLHGTTATLSAVGGAAMGQTVGYVIADYLLQHAERVRAVEPIPASVWEAVLDHLTDTDDVANLAESASARLLYRYAVPLYRRAADAGNRQAADQWAIHTGDPAGIADLKARAEDHGDESFNSEQAAEQAAQGFAEALVRLGDLDGLRALFRPATARWGPNWRISQELARALADRGAFDELRALADRGDLAAAEQLADFLAMRDNAHELRARAQFEPSVVLPVEDTLSRLGETEQTAARERLATYLAHRNDLAELAARTDAPATSRLFTLLRHRGDVAGMRRIAEAQRGYIEHKFVHVLVHRGDLQELLSLARRTNEGPLDQIARVFVHRGAIDELEALTEYYGPAVDRLAALLADRGNIARLQQLARHDMWAASTLVEVLTSRGGVAALRAFESSVSDMDTQLTTQALNTVLVHRGELDELAARARQGDSDATRKLVYVLGDRGDVDAAWQVLREAGQHRHRRVTSIHDELVVDLDELRTRADEGDGLAAARLASALVRRGDFDQLWARARMGDDHAADMLAKALPHDSGDVDAAWQVLREAGQHRHRRVTSIHEELVVDFDELRTRADEGDGVAAARLASALVRRGDFDQLWARARMGDDHAAGMLAKALVHRGELEALRTLADDGHREAAERLVNVLVYRGRVDELTIRADRGDNQANERLLDIFVHRGDLDALRRRADAGDLKAAMRWNDMIADRGDIELLRDQVGNYSDLLEDGASSDYMAADLLADILVDRDELNELRARADNHQFALAHRLAELLADRNELDELRARANVGDSYARMILADVLADRHAMDELRARTQEHPDDLYAPERLICLLVAQGDLAEAHRILLTQIKKGDHRAARQLPELLVWLGHHDEARQIARHGLNTDGSPATPAGEVSP